MADPRPIRTALIGLGNSGRFYHLPHLVAGREFELQVVCAAHPEHAADVGQRFGARAVADWRSAVARDDVELVVVAVPHRLHHEVGMAALRAGKHVLMDKPLALSVAEVDELAQASAQAKRHLFVFHQRRWEADFQEILASLRAGELGPLWYAAVARSHQGRYRAAGADRPHAGREYLDWAHLKASGGGIAQVVGPHPVDHLLQLANSPVHSVTGRTHVRDEDEVEDWIGIDVDFESGAHGRVDVFRWTGTAPPRFAVYGSEGSAVSVNAKEVSFAFTERPSRRIFGLPLPGTLGAEIYADVVAALRTGRPPQVKLSEARAVVQVLELAARSGSLGSIPLRTTETES